MTETTRENPFDVTPKCEDYGHACPDSDYLTCWLIEPCRGFCPYLREDKDRGR